jgi:integrase
MSDTTEQRRKRKRGRGEGPTDHDAWNAHQRLVPLWTTGMSAGHSAMCSQPPSCRECESTTCVIHCATLLLAQGVHPKAVQELLGHSQISLTMDTYSTVLPSVSRETAARMDELLRA